MSSVAEVCTAEADKVRGKGNLNDLFPGCITPIVYHQVSAPAFLDHGGATKMVQFEYGSPKLVYDRLLRHMNDGETIYVLAWGQESTVIHKCGKEFKQVWVRYCAHKVSTDGLIIATDFQTSTRECPESMCILSIHINAKKLDDILEAGWGNTIEQALGAAAFKTIATEIVSSKDAELRH